MHTSTDCSKCLMLPAADYTGQPANRQGAHADSQKMAHHACNTSPPLSGCLKNLFDCRLLEYPTALLNTIVSESEQKLPSGLLYTLYSYVPWVYGHSIHVAIISLVLAIHLGYAPSALHDIGLGAFLHDIGKLLIPKTILEKEGPLTHFEMVDMRQHCILGIGLIKDSDLPEDCTTVILQHHERMDGSGYPYGVSGTHIHRNSQIVMVADVLDALTSHRPYRMAYGKDTALEIMGEEACRFSEDILDVLKAVLK